MSEIPKKSELASKYPRLADIYNKLERIEVADRSSLWRNTSLEKMELWTNAVGVFEKTPERGIYQATYGWAIE